MKYRIVWRSLITGRNEYGAHLYERKVNAEHNAGAMRSRHPGISIWVEAAITSDSSGAPAAATTGIAEQG